jgi:RNA polymerase sigma factor (sigma-70 family)
LKTKPSASERRAEFLALTGELRPELHRYCARLMGSVIDGEDVVQDTMARALVALDEVEEMPQLQPLQLRPWLFRVAHNRAIDLLRGRTVHKTEPIEAAFDIVDEAGPDPMEILMRQEAVETAVSCFAELPLVQRSVVILKDVLDESLKDIAELLDLSVDAVKAHLARGRSRLRGINARTTELVDARPVSAAIARYVALFNAQNWEGLRALLADDVKLHQSTYPVRVGSADVGRFFTIYATFEGVRLQPAWVEGREVIAVFEKGAGDRPSYFMWLEWRDDRISFIRDYRYARYIMDDAKLRLTSDDGATPSVDAV